MIVENTSRIQASYKRSIRWATWGALIIFVFLLFSLAIQMLSEGFWAHFQVTHIFATFILVLTVFVIYHAITKLLDSNKIQLIIDETGIWTVECDIWSWQDIWYYSITEDNGGKGQKIILEIKLKDGVCDEDNIQFLPIDEFNQSEEQIMSVIQRYALIHNVQNLGRNVE